MRIMSGRSSKPTIVAKTAECEIKHTFFGKRIRVLHQVKCDKSPVDAADAQMLSQVVLKLITTLSQHQPELVRSS